MEELMNNDKSSILQKYAGKNISLAGNKKIYYVNNYGFTHEYSTGSWKAKPNSCLFDPIEISNEDFGKLPKGDIMASGIDCDIAGYNIENKSSGDMTWVDIKGEHHSYTTSSWKNRSDSCKSVPTKNVNHTNVDAVISGTPMTDESTCNRLNVDPKILDNLTKLNRKLLTLAKELLVDANNLAVTDIELKYKLDDLKSDISSKISNLENDKTQFKMGKYDIGSKYNSNLASVRDDSQLKLDSNYTKYMLWLVICIGIISLTMYTSVSDDQSITAQVIILAIASIVLYQVLVYIYNSFM